MKNINNEINLKKIIIRSYENPYENKKQIFKENSYKSGIYCWKNKITGKLYIGSAVNITKRLYCYLSVINLERELLKYNSLIYRALLKYNYHAFQLNILKYCEKNDLIKWEQYYIDLLSPEYNILRIAGSSLGHKHSCATLLKLKSYKPSLETLVKLRLSKELSGNTIIVINKKNNLIKKYNSFNSAAKDLNVTRQGLKYCMNKKILLKKIYLLIRLIKISF